MKHLLKKITGKGKKSTQPPQPPNPPGRHFNTAGPPASQTGLDDTLTSGQSFPSGSGSKLTISPGEGGGMGSRITLQDAMGVDRSLPASGASTPGPAIGDTCDADQPTGEPSRSPRMAPIFTRISLSLPLAESIRNDVGSEIGCAEPSRSTRGYVDIVGSHSSYTSRKGSPRGHIACRRRE